MVSLQFYTQVINEQTNYWIDMGSHFFQKPLMANINLQMTYLDLELFF